YDRRALYQAERAMLRKQGLTVPKEASFIRVGNPPLLFWLLQPLTGRSFVEVGWVWVSVMYGSLMLAFLMFLRCAGWTRWTVPTVLFLLMPQTIFAAYYGNVDGLVLVGLGAGYLLLRRYPFLAGLIFTFAWLKPQVAVPAVALAALFVTPSRMRLLAGF